MPPVHQCSRTWPCCVCRVVFWSQALERILNLKFTKGLHQLLTSHIQKHGKTSSNNSTNLGGLVILTFSRLKEIQGGRGIQEFPGFRICQGRPSAMQCWPNLAPSRKQSCRDLMHESHGRPMPSMGIISDNNCRSVVQNLVLQNIQKSGSHVR